MCTKVNRRTAELPSRKARPGWRVFVFALTVATLVGALFAQAGRRAHPTNDASTTLNVVAVRSNGAATPITGKDISLFDNGSDPPKEKRSRGLLLKPDTAGHRVSLVKQFRPVGEGTALQRLDGVHGASVGQKKWTLLMTLFPKAQQRCPSAKIAAVEFRAGDSEMPGEARNVFASDVHKSRLLATAYTSGLTLKAHCRV